MFGCYVRTSGGSVISGEVESRDSAPGPWRDYYAKQGYVADPVDVSSGDIRAVAHPDHAYVYIPCT
ncbi:hypothetical protein, partial [Streptomyces sp. NRRL S-118]|uniref:hypothetical protein n=1 Tax=Streptomyces sp. NRRL S-118 TaxID=1463881 RepID=UPI000587A303